MSSELFRTSKQPRMTTWEGLAAVLERAWQRPEILGVDEYVRLDTTERRSYNSSRAGYVSGGIRLPTQNTDRAQKLFESMLRANVNAPNREGLIVNAEPHLGKTTLVTALMEWLYGRFQAEFPLPEYRGHVPVVYVLAKPDTSGKALAKSLLAFFGATPLRNETTVDIIDRVIGLMQDSGTHMVCIDEFHNIASNNTGNGHTVDYIKNLHNEVEATFVISGIEVTKSKVLTDTPRGRQLRSRFTEHAIEPFNLVDQDQERQWQQLLLGFERELPLLAQERNSILQFRSLLMKRTNGSIGALRKLLTRITVDLIWADDPQNERLTGELIASAATDIASREAELLADAAVIAQASNSRRRKSGQQTKDLADAAA
ncbi:hypothetical protein ASE16_02060 [Leifsonia sp. Root227]|uniref:TniB family NTP-binding protein n=1 Tax=Leifsonia sp. Root227 TaxID=1736496 RepID=UPI0006F794AB|nr:TniB family NTP-binding protein [Leifsonia sp. Root227]KRC51877.1 hypothetical protein ASE16_02060 [Leifsonia sp. Root227]